MSGESPRNIVSRRNRPAKAPLSRDGIVATALQILEQDGLSGLSLRRVATALDTGAASLYVYVANLEELHSLMLDQALASIPLPVRGSRWQGRIKSLLLSYFQILYDHPGLAQIAIATIAAGPNSLRVWEALLALLKEGGVGEIKAAWGVDLLILYVTAIAAEQSLRRDSGQALQRVEKTLSNVSAEDYPLVFAAREAMLSGNGDTRSDWALDVILGGIVTGQLPLDTSTTVSRGGRTRGAKPKK